MNDLHVRKGNLSRAVIYLILDVGDREDEALSRIAATRTAAELDEVERWIRQLDAEARETTEA